MNYPGPGNVCRYDNGVLKSVNFAALYEFQRNQENPTGSGNCPVRLAFSERKNDMFLTLLRPVPSETSLARARGGLLTLARPQKSDANNLQLVTGALPMAGRARRAARPMAFQRLATKKYVIGSREMEIPFGLPRFVNAKTLKAMLGARRSTLLRKVGERWEICPDSFQVDLQDSGRLFRLNDIEIYS